ncbi:MAG: DUF1501 domain-containing protein, partial [Planctomycetaceae bacterium]
MLLFGHHSYRHCGGFTRREFLRVGGTSLAGLTLEGLLRADEPTTDSNRPSAATAPAQSLILIYLAGGPSQHETFDPKP